MEVNGIILIDIFEYGKEEYLCLLKKFLLRNAG